MKQHRYKLEKYKGIQDRYTCPNCRRNRTFTRYIDTMTGEHVHSTVGRCDREERCGYHYTPKQYFEQNNITSSQCSYSPIQLKPEPEDTDYIDFEVFKKSLACYDSNNFITFLNSCIGENKAKQAIERYYVGTSKHWNGASVFWQIDTEFKIRGGKIMLYDAITGKRVKDPYAHITWVHRALKQDGFNLSQCFFGEHLLSQDLTKQVAIVESEKTAIICNAFMPEFIWLATSSRSGLTEQKMKVLKGRTVALFPDLGTHNYWQELAKGFSKKCSIRVSNVLEMNTTDAEKEEGFDLADYLLLQRHC